MLGVTFVAGSLFLAGVQGLAGRLADRSEGSLGQQRSSVPSASSLSLFMTLALQHVLPHFSQQVPATFARAKAAS